MVGAASSPGRRLAGLGVVLLAATLGFQSIQFAAAGRAEAAAGCLVWPPREDPYPVGYYCGLEDPDGNRVEFSYGQPLGPGAEDVLRRHDETQRRGA